MIRKCLKKKLTMIDSIILLQFLLSPLGKVASTLLYLFISPSSAKINFEVFLQLTK